MYGVHKNAGLRSLLYSFDEAEIDDDKLQLILEALVQETCKCIFLSMYEAEMKQETVEKLAEVLLTKSPLNAINITGYPIPLNIFRGIKESESTFDEKEDAQLVKYLEADGKGLDLRMEKYGWIDCTIMAKLLKDNEQLEELILSESKLDATCIKCLAVGLEPNRALRILTLAHNQIGSEGAVTLAEYLKVNKVLLELDVDDNGIEDLGALVGSTVDFLYYGLCCRVYFDSHNRRMNHHETN